MAIIKLINISIYYYHFPFVPPFLFFCVAKTLKTYSLCKFQQYAIVNYLSCTLKMSL